MRIQEPGRRIELKPETANVTKVVLPWHHSGIVVQEPVHDDEGKILGRRRQSIRFSGMAVESWKRGI